MHPPFETTEIFIHTDDIERPPTRICEVGNDYRGMPHDRHHRMTLIDGTLTNPRARVRMHVGEHLQLLVFAVLPEGGVAGGVERNRAALLGVGVKIVVAEVCSYKLGIAVAPTKQECAAFALTSSSAAKIENEPRPKPNWEADCIGCCVKHPHNLRWSARLETLRGSRRWCANHSR